MPKYNPNEAVNLIYRTTDGKQEFRENVSLVDALSFILDQPDLLTFQFIITREGEPILTVDEVMQAAKDLGMR
jgi:hypothetical protein